MNDYNGALVVCLQFARRVRTSHIKEEEEEEEKNLQIVCKQITAADTMFVFLKSR